MTGTDVVDVVDAVDSFRHRLGPVGVCLPSLGPASADAERSAARCVEELGYGSIWAGEAIGGKEPSLIRACSWRRRIASSLAPVSPTCGPDTRRHGGWVDDPGLGLPG